jgi:hypothetical protein
MAGYLTGFLANSTPYNPGIAYDWPKCFGHFPLPCS